MTPAAIRVVLADDHFVVRAGLKAVLEAAPDITVVGEASDGREAVVLAHRVRPDVVVMDVGMPELDGVEATREIVAAGLPTHVLMLSMHAEEGYLVLAMEAGATGYLVKSDAHRDLADAIRIVARGDCFVRPSTALLLARELSATHPLAGERRLFAKLSLRERAVLRFVALGFTSAEIGERVSASTRMVDVHKNRIRRLLNLSHRSHYVRFALRLGLLAAPAPIAAPRP